MKAVNKLCRLNDWQFLCQDFEATISVAEESDFIYCDPPYVGRHVDYFNSWDDREELRLFDLLSETPANFILSTWHSNQHRHNPYVDQLWSKFVIVNREHFYHVGAKETNRKPMLEALVINYQPATQAEVAVEYHQPKLLETGETYTN